MRADRVRHGVISAAALLAVGPSILLWIKGLPIAAFLTLIVLSPLAGVAALLAIPKK